LLLVLITSCEKEGAESNKAEITNNSGSGNNRSGAPLGPTGSITVWSSVSEEGFAYEFKTMNVTVGDFSGTIYAGKHTTVPSCGADYCFKAELTPGKYTVTGTVYPPKPATGIRPPTYTTSKIVTVVAGECTKVDLK
jgi:hypothetical protein